MSKASISSTGAARARYLAVFIGLIAAFAVLTVWNINTGSVHISVGDIARIIFLRPTPASGGASSWWAATNRRHVSAA